MAHAGPDADIPDGGAEPDTFSYTLWVLGAIAQLSDE